MTELSRDQVRSKSDREAAYKESRAALDGIQDPDAVVTSALAKYERQQKAFNDSIGSVRTLADGWKAVGAAAGFRTPLTGAITVAGDILFERGIAIMEKDRDQKQGVFIEEAMQDLRRRDKAAFEELASLSQEDARSRFFGSSETAGLFQSTKTYRNLDPKARAIIADAKVDLLAAAILREQDHSDQRQNRTDAELATISQKLVAYEERFDEFAKSTRSALSDLKVGQEGLQDAYRVLGEEVTSNSFRLNSLEKVAFGQLTPKEQVEALRGGMFTSVVANMSAAKREEFEAGLEKAALIQEAHAYISDANQVVDGIRGMAGALGLSEELAKPLAIAQKGLAAGEVVLAAMGGNPVAIISALGRAGNLFGGGEDPVGSQLSAIRKDIQQLRKDIYELRQEVFQYHQETLSTLSRISDQIDVNYRSLYSQGENTYTLLSLVERGVNELLLQELSTCKEVLSAWEMGTSYEFRAATLDSAFRSEIAACDNGINTRFATGGMITSAGLSTIFLPRKSEGPSDRTYRDEVDKALTFERRTLVPTLRYAQRYVFPEAMATCDRQEALYLALTAPVLAFGEGSAAAELVARECGRGSSAGYHLFTPADLSRLAGGETAVVPERGPKVRSGLLANLISGETVTRYGDQVFRLSAFWEFARAEGAGFTMRPLAEVRQGLPHQAMVKPIIQLRRVLDVVNAAIAQQNLLAGDMLLPILSEHVLNGQQLTLEQMKVVNTDKECETSTIAAGSPAEGMAGKYSSAACVLATNALLRQNFMLYHIRRLLKNPTVGARVSYATGIDERDPRFLKAAFSQRVPLEWAKCAKWAQTESWCLKLPAPRVSRDMEKDLEVQLKDGSMLIPLPRWHDLAAYRPANANDSLDRLLALRAKIEDRLTAYAVFPSLTTAEKQLLRAGALAWAAPARMP